MHWENKIQKNIKSKSSRFWVFWNQIPKFIKIKVLEDISQTELGPDGVWKWGTLSLSVGECV